MVFKYSFGWKIIDEIYRLKELLQNAWIKYTSRKSRFFWIYYVKLGPLLQDGV